MAGVFASPRFIYFFCAGLVPYSGIVGLQHSIDSIGPMTNSTIDNAILLGNAVVSA